MMLLLALIYVMATAKPISIRRLSALFVVVLVSANCALRMLQLGNVSRDAFWIATAISLFAWSVPLVETLRLTVCNQKLSLEALHSASDFVWWTYMCAFIAVRMAALTGIASFPHTLTLAALSRLLVAYGVTALALQLGYVNWTLRKRLRPQSSRPRPTAMINRACAATIARLSCK